MNLKLFWLVALFFLAIQEPSGALASELKKIDDPSFEVKFNKKTLEIKGVKLTVEIAETEDQQQRGLMFRKSLKEDHGMLFVFKNSEVRAFWMKNTFIDLDIGYFDANKKLIDIQTMKSTSSVMDQNLPNYPSSGPAMYALEVPKGWFKKKGIKKGTTFILK